MELNQDAPSGPQTALLSVVVPIYNEAFCLPNLLAELICIAVCGEIGN